MLNGCALRLDRLDDANAREQRGCRENVKHPLLFRFEATESRYMSDQQLFIRHQLSHLRDLG